MLIKELMNLMVGDILMAYHDDGESQRNFPVIVDGIDANGTLVDGECYISWKPLQKEDCEEDYADEMNPIPLTAEILEKNGFRYEHNYGQYYRSILGDYAKDKEPTISIGWNSKGEMCEWDIADGKRGASYGRHLLGVHELQHALRLCGLTELADNFKI